MDDRTIDAAMRRPQRYWYEDGLGELAAGALFLLVGLLFFSEAVWHLPPSFSSIGLIVLAFFGIQLARRVVKALKSRLTYPRTGEVTYRQAPRYRSKLAAVALAAMVIAAVVAFAIKSTLPLSWVPFLDGFVIGLFLLYFAHKNTLNRFYLLSAVSVMLGFLIGMTGMGDQLGSAAYFSAFGVALLVSGGATLSAYLHRPVPPPEG